MSEVTAQIWCRSFHRGFVTVLLCCYPTCLSLQHLCAQHGAVTCLHLLWGSIKNSPPVLSFTEVTHLYLKKHFLHSLSKHSINHDTRTSGSLTLMLCITEFVFKLHRWQKLCPALSTVFSLHVFAIITDF